MRLILCTGIQLAGWPLFWLSGLRGKDHFCQDWMRPRARPATARIPGLPRYTFAVEGCRQQNGKVRDDIPNLAEQLSTGGPCGTGHLHRVPSTSIVCLRRPHSLACDNDFATGRHPTNADGPGDVVLRVGHTAGSAVRAAGNRDFTQ